MKNKKENTKAEKWNLWWDRITAVAIFAIVTPALVADFIRDWSIDNHLLLIIIISLNIGLTNRVIHIFKNKNNNDNNEE